MTAPEPKAVTRQEIYDMRQAMNRYGGSFVKAISEAFAVADERNTQRLLAAFPDYVSQYSAMAKRDISIVESFKDTSNAD